MSAHSSAAGRHPPPAPVKGHILHHVSPTKPPPSASSPPTSTPLCTKKEPHLPEKIPSSASPSARKPTTVHPDGHHLSERDSIFADHYTNSVDDDPATPTLSPLRAAPGVAAAPHDMILDMEGGVRVPSKFPAHSFLRSNLLPSHRVASRADAAPPPAAGATLALQTTPSRGTIHGVRRAASDSSSWTTKFHVSMPRNAVTEGIHAQRDEGRPFAHHGGAWDSDTSIIDEERAAQARPARGSSMKIAMAQAAKKDRSVSRGRSHVEKNIEATLETIDPGKNARSRKSSHYMGLFRENVGAADGKKRDLPAVDENAPKALLSTSPSKPLKVTTEGTASPHMSTDRRPSIAEETVKKDKPADPSPATGQRTPTSSEVSQASPISSQPVSPFQTEHDPYFRKQDVLKRAAESKRPAIPASLLQEIRQHHDLTPVPLAVERALDALRDDKVGHSRLRKVTTADSPPAGHDEEHISSAVYFPHPGPSPEEIEDYAANHVIEQEAGVGAIERAAELVRQITRGSTDSKRSAVEAMQPEHIDISVQSKHEKSVFHGNYQPPEEDLGSELGLTKIDEAAVAAAYSASESEAESSDGYWPSSQIADGEMTPTATPAPKNQVTRRRRSAVAGGPKGAVVLEPYNHQVGGHSTMFRVSKRAVCKQLNNRENEFYEHIEQHHPEMLRFLPRYIGVLNVTFTKGRKQFKSSKAEKSASRERRISVPSPVNGAKGETPDRDSLHRSASASGHEHHQPRVVSHSQQIGEIPQVILNQNRHILPFNFLDLPERPRSADPSQLQHRDSRLLNLASSNQSPPTKYAPTTKSPLRPSGPEQTPSWGRTSVNTKLTELVMRDIFYNPAPIHHHHRRHGPTHSTLPRSRPSATRPKDSISEDLPNGDGNGDRSNVDELAGDTAKTRQHEGESRTDTDHPAELQALPNVYSSSASAFEDRRPALTRTTTNTNDAPDIPVNGHQRLRRRHSGSGLRRRGLSVSHTWPRDLEYFEEESYGADAEDDVFPMDDEKGDSTSTKRHSVSNSAASATSDVSKAELEPFQSGAGEGKSHVPPVAPLANGIGEQNGPSNPKQAQTEGQDQRMEFYLVLEDLTAGMGRPCVLDLKMGTRQYGVEANAKKVVSQRRKCKTTTSQQLGVRICGMQTWDAKKQQQSYEDKYYGRDLKAGREFREALTRFLYDGISYSSVARHIPTILSKISKLESMVRRLPGYRFYASSLLMIYDAEPDRSKRALEKGSNAQPSGYQTDDDRSKESKTWPPPIELKIVDFANCVMGQDELPSTAICPPQHPHDIDRGYLRGLRTLKMYFQRILRDINEDEFAKRGEENTMAYGGHGDYSDKHSSDGTSEDLDAGEVSI